MGKLRGLSDWFSPNCPCRLYTEGECLRACHVGVDRRRPLLPSGCDSRFFVIRSRKPAIMRYCLFLSGVARLGVLVALSLIVDPTRAEDGRAADGMVRNPDFTEGTAGPAGWRLSGGQGKWVDRQILEVTGTGNDSNLWRSEEIALKPGTLYRFGVRARGRGAGSFIAGPSVANRDYSGLSGDWAWYGHVFRVPDNVSKDYLRVGQWQAKGTVQFDAVGLKRAIPVCRPVGKLLLGEGESIQNGRYSFQGSFDREGSNFHRTLQSATAGFNSDRWCFGGKDQVTYRFSLPGCPFQSGEISFNVNYHVRGDCLAEVSRDGKQWQTLTTQKGVGTAQASLPSEFLPAEVVYLRLRSAAENSNYQVNRVALEGQLAGSPPEGVGQTHFIDLDSESSFLGIEGMSFDDNPQSGHVMLRLQIKNRREKAGETGIRTTTESPKRSIEVGLHEVAIEPGRTATLDVKIPVQQPGRYTVRLLGLDAAIGMALVGTLRFSVPEYYRADYGEVLPGSTPKTGVWWCDAMHKVPRGQGLPTASGPAARLSASRHDHEAVQIVVRAEKPLKGLTAIAGPLSGPSGATIPAEHVKILRVHYHFVHHPTDATGVRDLWPDALPPLAKPIDVAAGDNQPLWVLVYVPKDAKAGDYAGTVELKAQGWSTQVPIKLHVWDFTLPDRNHLETAFGLSPELIFRYHQAKTDADRRKLLDLYFQSFAEHRISPYDPTPLDRFRVKFVPEAKAPRAELDFSAFDAAMTRAVEQYHFTGFRLDLPGMGGGTFHSRVEPSIQRFGENTPEYQALFSSCVKQIEEHLRQKGWLGMEYVYWFDEPDPKDYAFVRRGMERIKKYAPGIRRMLTEEPAGELAGAVNVWCPISNNYDHDAAEKRRAQGERFWWYVCTGPKAPYCTLFIDHPATELRVWHWQTWQRKIVGTLVWESNYWTSEAAFPDKPQNPYEDPMGYVSGYSTPKGTKAYWGNGDGRFIYPPEAAAVPGLSGPEPVIAPPVSSIRWEMLREGVEDYEYLYLLRDLLAKKRAGLPAAEAKRIESLLEVPASITKDMTTFTTDSAPIYARRAEIAEAIETLSKARD